MFFIRRIAGDSMLPTLRPRQIVIFKQCRRYKKGQIVAVDASGQEVVKRLLIVGARRAYLQGDCQASTDYCTPAGHLRGRLILKFDLRASGLWLPKILRNFRKVRDGRR